MFLEDAGKKKRRERKLRKPGRGGVWYKGTKPGRVLQPNHNVQWGGGGQEK